MENKAVLVKKQSSDLIVFSNEKKELIKKTIGNNLSNLEFDLFLSVAASRGLDPVLGQIHAVKRNFSGEGGSRESKMVIQVGIDGFRLIAHRTGEYAGKSRTQFSYKGESEIPDKVELTVYRLVQGQKCEFTASVRWKEYYPGDKLGFMWKKMPETMLEKCAEAKALRMAFPGDLSGLYIPEETLEREERGVEPLAEKEKFADSETQQKAKDLISKFSKIGISLTELEEQRQKIADEWGLEDLKALAELGALIKNGKKTKQEVFGG